MILLVTPSQRAAACAEALKQNTGEDIAVVNTLHRAATLLRKEVYSAVVLDQHLFEAEPDDAESVIQHLGTAVPIEMSFAVSGVERVVREVRAALRRRTREQAAARQAASALVRSELNGTVTALLLQCDLALGTPGMPPAVAEKMVAARGLIQKLRAQLQSGAHNM